MFSHSTDVEVKLIILKNYYMGSIATILIVNTVLPVHVRTLIVVRQLRPGEKLRERNN